MEEEKAMIPYFVHESAMARAERTIKRLIIVCILLIVETGYWIYYESQFEDIVTTEVTQDAEWESGDVIMNGTGEVYVDGESETDG